jgi:23S rRNA-/tRNA-specific pseudouridylate synthase
MDITDISIIYQDHHLLIVNKPAGVVIHPTYKHTDDTLWNALLVYLSQQEGDDWQPPELPDEPAWARAPLHIQQMLREKRTQRLWQEEGLLPRPGLLHRLDKDTSGVVALARTERSRRHIVRQFHDHTLVKRYFAVVQRGARAWAQPRTTFTVKQRLLDGSEIEIEHCDLFSMVGAGELVLEGPLCRDPDDRRRCIVGPDGQDAITVVKGLAVEHEFALVEVRPITGRTHQIRAHLAALGYALVGDATYALPPEHGTPEAALKRQFLHAYSLELRRYPDNVLCTFVAPLADDLVSWMQHYFPSGLGVFHASTTVPDEYGSDGTSERRRQEETTRCHGENLAERHRASP